MRLLGMILRGPALALSLGFALTGPTASAQGAKADFARAAGLKALTEHKVLHGEVRPQWLPDGSAFIYRDDLPGGNRAWVLVPAQGASKRPAFDHEALAMALSRMLGRAVTASQLPIEEAAFTAPTTLRFRLEKQRWTCDLKTFVLSLESETPKKEDDSPQPPKEVKSPDGRWVAALRGENFAVSRVKEGRSSSAAAMACWGMPTRASSTGAQTPSGWSRCGPPRWSSAR